MASNYVTNFREDTPNGGIHVKEEPRTPIEKGTPNGRMHVKEEPRTHSEKDTPNGRLHVKEEPRSPIENDFEDRNYLENPFFENPYPMRKSLSMSDLAALLDHMVNLEIAEEERNRKPSTPQELSSPKFVSMAEVHNILTPGRFHSKMPQKFRGRSTSRPNLTVPQSPMLRSKTRARPLNIMSQKDKEELEAEKMKKFKIKAQPVPKSVIEGTNLPEVPKKPITIPEPFKLTEIQKKLAQSPDQHNKFKARPAPKHILEKPQIPVKAISPKFHSETSAVVKQLEKHQRLGPVKPEPFSFEKRDEEIKRRKEEWIKSQIEKDKKQASVFKAQPLPSGLKKPMHKAAAQGSSSTSSSENKENLVRFEARPPTVLYREPFKPVLSKVPVETKPFNLTSLKRAAEREKFDQLFKEKEEEQERMRLQKKKKEKEAEEKIQAEIRSKLVHHAKPVPALKAFVPAKSDAPLTVPETPKFVRRLRENN